jgi:hypothetical protein
LSSLPEATNVHEISNAIVLETSTVDILKNVEIDEVILKQYFTISVYYLNNNLVVVIDKSNDIVRYPFSLAKGSDSICCIVFALERNSISVDSTKGG